MLKLLELFGGIGACSKALERLGIDYKIVDYVEIDKYAVKSFNAIHNTNFEPQDITQWDKNIEVDLVMHGSPCQDFSLAGLQAGGDEGSGTRSSLMYETIRIVKKTKPKYVIWENVKNLLSKKHRHNFDSYLQIMESLGYKNYYQVLNAKDYGIPQNRERVFTISIRNDIDKEFIFPEKRELKLKLKDMLEDEVDEKYYLSEKMIKNISVLGTKNFKNNDSKINLDIARPLTSTMSKMHRAGADNYLCDELPSNYDLSIPIKNNTKQDGNRQPFIRNDRNMRKQLCNDLISNNKVEENDVIKINYTTDVINGKKNYKMNNNISPTLTTASNNEIAITNNMRIRKLTPKECWRLMGFDDEDFEKAEKVNSNTQLYKQAGNSIVVNVLMAIFKELL